MAEIVNLRQVRKRRKRDERAGQAEQNRALFGENTAVRKQRKAAEERQAQLHKAHRRDTADDAD
jgi:hypothetical protein